MKRQIVRFAPCVALMILGVIGTSRPADTQEQHPKLRAAVRALREAEEYLRATEGEFCGHKSEAMRRSQDAMRELQQMLECDRK